MLRTHYRQPIDWTAKGLQESEKILNDWYAVLGDAPAAAQPDPEAMEALCDDLNTPRVLTRLHALAGEIRPAPADHQLRLKASLRASGVLLGILGQTREAYLRS